MWNILNLFFPKKCVGCNQEGNYLCLTCLKNLKQSELVCPFCERASLGGLTHPICCRNFSLDGLWSLGTYSPPLKNAIQKLKYKWITDLAETLVNITIEYWAKYQPIFLDEIKRDKGINWVIVPVPLHWARQNWRGFNQSALLGKFLSQKTGLDYKEYLQKTRFTKPQVGLEAPARKTNIKGAFSLTNSHNLAPNTLSSKKILLIDDVWTTGSTLKECCYVLKRSGAKKVWAITLAR